MPTLRPRPVAMAIPLLLAIGSVLSADDRYQRPDGRFGRVAGRPDRADLVAGYAPASSSRDEIRRPYDRVAPPAPPPPPRRTTAQYFPGLRSGQYNNPNVRHHCTPSRGYLAGSR